MILVVAAMELLPPATIRQHGEFLVVVAAMDLLSLATIRQHGEFLVVAAMDFLSPAIT